jgi:hypothetical protein
LLLTTESSERSRAALSAATTHTDLLKFTDRLKFNDQLKLKLKDRLKFKDRLKSKGDKRSAATISSCNRVSKRAHDKSGVELAGRFHTGAPE